MWWATTITDEQLKVLLEASYTGLDATPLQDETAHGGRSVQEQLHARRQHLLGKLSDTTLNNYRVGLRLWLSWSLHQQKSQPLQENWCIAHPESKVDRFLEDVLALQGPWQSKGNTEFVASTKMLCAALAWLRKLQPGVPKFKDACSPLARALSLARQTRADHRNSTAYDRFSTGRATAKVVEDWEVDSLLLRCTNLVCKQSHWRHKARFSLLSSVSGGLRADDLARLCYSSLALSQPIQTQPTLHMQLLHICTNKSKTNQSGRDEVATFARHLDPKKCVLGALASLVVYDLLVYQLQLIPMMLAGNLAWRSAHLLWRDPGDIMRDQTYDSVVAPLRSILKQEDMEKTAVGHLGRNTGLAKLAELGVPLPLMRMWGRWFSPGCAMEGSYLPKAILRDLETAAQLAGHTAQWRTSHFLGRQMIKPPEHWVNAIIPGIHAAGAEVRKRNLQVGRPHHKDGTAEVCLQALLHLAEVYWQDLACFQAESGPHPDLQQLPQVLAIVNTSDYAVFQQQVWVAHNFMLNQQKIAPPERMKAGAMLQQMQRQIQNARDRMQRKAEGQHGNQQPPQQPQQGQPFGHHSLAKAKELVTSWLAHLNSRQSCSLTLPTAEVADTYGSSTGSGRGQQQPRLGPGRPPKRQGPGRPRKPRRGQKQLLAVLQGQIIQQRQQQQHHQPAAMPHPAEGLTAGWKYAPREAPPLFSSKLKTVAEGWAEWHGLHTGRPAVNLVLQQVGSDSSITLGKYNINAKRLRVWLLRAVHAAQAVGIQEEDALTRLQTVADSFDPGLSYLDLCNAIAKMVKHQHSKELTETFAVGQKVSVADMLCEFNKVKLPIPSADAPILVTLDASPNRSITSPACSPDTRREQVDIRTGRTARDHAKRIYWPCEQTRCSNRAFRVRTEI